jgi:branched-chain amino acid aminotransferase
MSAKPGPAAHDPTAWVFFNGDFKRYNEVTFGLMTHALHYGTGCFEGLRAYWNSNQEQLFLVSPEAHFDRMQDSARILTLELPHESRELVEITVELLKRNDYRADTYIRPVLFKSGEGIGSPFGGLSTSFGIYTAEFGRFVDIERGIKCMVSTWRRVPDISIPVRAKVTGAYVNSNLAKSEAQRAGFDEAILLDMEGHVSEGTGENVFMKRHGAFVTPPVSSDILEGITRRTVIRLIEEELGLQVFEREIDRSELYAAEEVLMCGTGAEVCPVIEVDGRIVGDGKVGESTKKLQDAYFAMVRGDDPKRAASVVPVY